MSFVATAIGGIGGALASAGVLGAGAASLAGTSMLGAAAAGMGIGGAIGGAMGSKSASNQAADFAKNLQYQPIDLNALQAQAQNFAQQNVAKSIELEKQYFPQLSQARFGLQKQVSEDLARGGQLPTDVANQVTRASMAQAGTGGFGAGPLTAAQLGLTAYDLRTQAQQRANAVLAGQQLPTAGIDPGSLASAAIGQNQQMNQFQLDKAGAMTKAIQSQDKTNQAILGDITGAIKLFGNSGSPMTPKSSITTPTTLPKASDIPAFGFKF